MKSLVSIEQQSPRRPCDNNPLQWLFLLPRRPPSLCHAHPLQCMPQNLYMSTPLYVYSSFAETDTTFREIPHKGLTSVVSTTTARTFTECCVKCMKTDSCQAVSVTQATDYVMCSLSDSTDTEDDPGSSVYTGGKAFQAIYSNLSCFLKGVIIICPLSLE